MQKSLFTQKSEVLMKHFRNKITKEENRRLKEIYQLFENLPLEDIKGFSKSEIILNEGKIINSPFVSKEIINDSKKMKHIIKIKCIIGNIHFDINIHHAYLNHNLNFFIQNIMEYIQFISSFANHTSITTIIINYYLSNREKVINSKIPNKNEVNSGSCGSNGKTAIINIWRKEEILKVTIHELIHAFGFDRYNDTQEIIDHYNKRYNITSSKGINTNEAYTEIWANIINAFLITKKSKQKYKSFCYFISLEKCFCLFQAQKIMNHSGLDHQKKININKNTNVLSYYIIRMELYNNLSGFLNYCIQNNKNYLYLKDIESWLKFIKENNKIEKNNRRFNRFLKDNYIYKTLRMTILELRVL